jgi:G3E family GTPase
VAQTFFTDEEVKESFVLDGIVTVVDAKHVGLHFDDTREVREQIGFADVILLNKTDLVSPAELEKTEARIRKMNPVAKLYRTANSAIDLGKVLDVGGFDLKRALELEPDFLKDGEHEHDHAHGHEHEGEHEHEDEEHDHHHDEDITSVGIRTPGDLDEKKISEWLGTLLRTKGQDIFRMKGVLSVKGRENRFVFQGVHMLMDGRPDRPWGNEPRHNALIFIGRNLDRAALNEGFRQCLA